MPDVNFKTLLICMVLLAAGCKSSQPAQPTSDSPAAPTSESAPSRSDARDSIGESARSAAMLVAGMPEINHPLTEREVRLWTALFRAAYESNVGDTTEHFLLESPPRETLPPLAIDRREFLLRVLAGLADLDVPMTWAAPGRSVGVVEYFPGTRERATRLRARVHKRLDEQATVQAEISDWTADIGSSRQAVTATWDGENWQLERDRVRIVW